ncbi:YybS family protein [Halalkalibacterium halodurans]|uniref:BH4032 protein n=1 Tax=Halalkalibacterium halodurans (strain ATCC BAA-125 / DSM 18197 / FERM 7344 / JCM 9153 / C-125) TaxID=272558 RepID=Q9K5Q6_HALH5|nr:YybS family protein [Halalkalibacterium halodurans]MED4081063.1 YybS family protein [Halalkalibacterium halodurans]MED4084873.1 YybS family protein [Halalkalibacterium halodurans]MED4103465.1 YybS family protein [Halalkalibacterium halodurans]MED4107759.1 YybS family protein [Halalkalibacterium halodurans]MED4123799.1 YybS family protein [Halalkalibacterium halodurans]
MYQTRPLTEGAVFASLFAVLFVITFFVPFIAFITMWFLPIPFLLYTLRHGLKPAVIVLLVASVVVMLILGPLLLLLALLFGTSGVVMGELYRREKSPFAVLLGGSLSNIAWVLLLFISSIVIMDVNPLVAAQETMRQSMQTAEQLIIGLGQEPSEALKQMEESINQLFYLGPAMVVICGTLLAAVTQLVAAPILKRLRHEVKPLPPFRTWSFPRSFLFYYLAVVVLFMIGFEEGSMPYIAVWNLLPVLEIIMAIQGFAVIFAYFHTKGVAKAVPVIIMILCIIVTPLLYLVRIIGIIDLGFDLRKRMGSQGK